MDHKTTIILGATLLIAVLIISSIGIGLAYQAQTDNTDNDISVSKKTILVYDNSGNELKSVKLPDVTFTESGDGWSPGYYNAYVTGNIVITNSSTSDYHMRIWVEMKNVVSWAAIDKISFRYQGSEYVLFDDSLDNKKIPNSMNCTVFTPKNDSTTEFTLTVIYKEKISFNPSDVTDFLESRVVFVQDAADDPVPAKYNVTFKYYKSGTPDVTVKYHGGDYVERPEDPVWEGHTFIGWYKESNGTNIWNFKEDIIKTSNVTLHAIWGYTVTFDHNNGSGNTDVGKAKSGGTVTAPSRDPSYIGYSFLGWYTSSTDFHEVNKWNFDTTVTGNTTLYAGWGYSVTFENNDGTGSKNVVKVLQDTTVTQPDVPTWTGHSFLGWYSDEGLTTAWDFNTAVDHNMTLYAKWNFTVTISGNGNGQEVSTVTADYGTKISEPAAPTAWTGHTFKNGWYTSPTDFSEGNKWNFAADTVTSDVTLYAGWTCTVTFDTRGGSSQAAVIVDMGSKLSVNNPTKSGHGFLGWFTSNDTKWNLETDAVTEDMALYAGWGYEVTFNMMGNGDYNRIVVVESGGKVTQPDDPDWEGHTFIGWYTGEGLTTAWNFTTDTVNSNTTIYAKWSYTVTFNRNGNGDPDTTVTANYGSTISAPETNPGWEGYAFKGWYTDPTDLSAGKVWNFASDTVISDMTLYAGWTCVVTFDKQGGTGDYSTQTVDKGGKVTQPADPTKSSYRFMGWYVKASGFTEDDKWDFSNDTISAAKTLYAGWGHQVILHMNCVDGQDATILIEDGTSISSSIVSNPTREGYTFTGWYTEAAAEHPWNSSITSDKELYAGWASNP